MDLKNRASILLLMACICNSVIASDTTEEEPTNAASPLVEEQASIAETPAQTEETTASEETKLDISGFIDGAYSYMLRSDLFPNEERIIANDASTNSFAIHQLAVKFAYQPKEGLGAVFLPIFGQDAFDYSPKGLDPNIGIHNFGFAPINAFAQYAQGSFTAYAGILTALTGYESMEPTEDINF